MPRPRSPRPSVTQSLELLSRVKEKLLELPQADMTALLAALGITQYPEFVKHLEVLQEHYGFDFMNLRFHNSGTNRLTEAGDRVLRRFEKAQRRVLAAPEAGRARPEHVRVGVHTFSFASAVVPAVAGMLNTPEARRMRFTFREFANHRSSLDALLLDPLHRRYVACVFGTQTDLVRHGRYMNAVEFLSAGKRILPVLIYPQGTDPAPTYDTLSEHTLVMPKEVPPEWSSIVPASPNDWRGGRLIRVENYTIAYELVSNGVGCSVFPGIFDGFLCTDRVRMAVAADPIPEKYAKPIDFGVYRGRNTPKHGTAAENWFIEQALGLLRGSAFDLPPGEEGGKKPRATKR